MLAAGVGAAVHRPHGTLRSLLPAGLGEMRDFVRSRREVEVRRVGVGIGIGPQRQPVGLVGDAVQGLGIGCLACRRIGQAVDRKKHTSELQSLMRISYAVFCLKKKTTKYKRNTHNSDTYEVLKDNKN